MLLRFQEVIEQAREELTTFYCDGTHVSHGVQSLYLRVRYGKCRNPIQTTFFHSTFYTASGGWFVSVSRITFQQHCFFTLMSSLLLVVGLSVSVGSHTNNILSLCLLHCFWWLVCQCQSDHIPTTFFHSVFFTTSGGWFVSVSWITYQQHSFTLLSLLLLVVGLSVSVGSHTNNILSL